MHFSLNAALKNFQLFKKNTQKMSVYVVLFTNRVDLVEASHCEPSQFDPNHMPTGPNGHTLSMEGGLGHYKRIVTDH